MNRALSPLLPVLLAAALTATLGACAPSVYDAPYPVVPVELPRDDAAHPAPIEWWYYTGHLEAESGEEVGFMLTFLNVRTYTLHSS